MVALLKLMSDGLSSWILYINDTDWLHQVFTNLIKLFHLNLNEVSLSENKEYVISGT